jgi:hypothetical protein
MFLSHIGLDWNSSGGDPEEFLPLSALYIFSL